MHGRLGAVRSLQHPRVEAGVDVGSLGKDRRDAMDKMSRALGEYMITGIKTTIPFEQAILQDPNFRRGVYSTNFVDQLLGGARRELIEEKA